MEKNIAIVCNPLAGSGQSVQLADQIHLKLEKSGIEHAVFKNDWPQGFDRFTDIFIVGGDGTLHFFVNKYPDTPLPLVIFKGGTGNDFHWTLYGNLPFEEQFQLALTGAPKPIDLGKCNQRYFINGVGVGFEAAISKSLTGKKKLPGKTSFFLSVLRHISTYKSAAYTIRSGNDTYASRYLLIDIYNGKRAGGGFYIAPEAAPTDGLFDIILSKALHPFQRLRYLPVIEKGKHLKLPFINYYRSAAISIESKEMIRFHLDGEYGEAGQLDIQLLPSKLLFRF